MLLADKADKMDSLNLLRYMAPMSLVLLVPAVVILEPGTFAWAPAELHWNKFERWVKANNPGPAI